MGETVYVLKDKPSALKIIIYVFETIAHKTSVDAIAVYSVRISDTQGASTDKNSLIQFLNLLNWQLISLLNFETISMKHLIYKVLRTQGTNEIMVLLVTVHTFLETLSTKTLLLSFIGFQNCFVVLLFFIFTELWDHSYVAPRV